MIDFDKTKFTKELDERPLRKANRDSMLHDYHLIVDTIKQSVANGMAVNWMIGEALAKIYSQLQYYNCSGIHNSYSLHMPLSSMGYNNGSIGAIIQSIKRKR